MAKSHLLLVLQTHSLGNSGGDYTRFCKAPKAEVTRRCTKSLVHSINHAVDIIDIFDFELVVLDDHSDEQTIQDIKDNLSLAKFPTKLIHLDTYGIMPSILACYEYGKKHGKDWVYFVQDDYLYEETAIEDMLFVAVTTSQKLGKYSSVFPYDDPYRYIPENTAITSHIIRECGRHWRTQVMTGSCFMTHHSIIIKEWDVFDAMGKHELSTDMEDKTINQLFRTRNYWLFVPLRSLALHMQGPRELDPFIDWKTLWDKFEKPNVPKIDVTQDNLLYLGYTGESLKDDEYAQDLLKYREYTLNKDTEHRPDIICDITNLVDIPSESFSCIYAKNVLQYYDILQVPIILKQFVRILKINGFAKIIVPNIKLAGMHLVQDKMFDVIDKNTLTSKTVYDIFYDKKSYSKTETMFSKSGYTKQLITTLADRFNFNVTVVEKDLNLIITLKK